MSQKFAKLKTLPEELFQLDQPDLDFGIYRVLHAKSAEVSQFLEKDLLPQVHAAFGAGRRPFFWGSRLSVGGRSAPKPAIRRRSRDEHARWAPPTRARVTSTLAAPLLERRRRARSKPGAPPQD